MVVHSSDDSSSEEEVKANRLGLLPEHGYLTKIKNAEE